MTFVPVSMKADASLTPALAERSSRFWLIVALVLAAAHFIVFVSLPLPPLHDYFGHLARIHIMDAQGSSAFIDRYYQYDWSLHSNFGGDLLIYGLAQAMPIEIAGRIVVAAIPAITILALAFVRREVFGRVDSTVLLATPFATAAWFGWGFINFTLAMALVLLAFGVWLRVREKSLWLRATALFAGGFVICLSHLVGWGVLGLMVFAWELAARSEGLTRFRSIVRAAPQAVLAVVPLVLALGTMLGGAGADSPHLFVYAGDHWFTKVDALFSALAFTSDRFDKYCVVLIVLVAVAAIALRLVVISRGMVLASGLVLLAYLACPSELLGAANADVRLLTPLGLIGLSAISWRRPVEPGWRRATMLGLTLVAAVVSVGRFAYTSEAVVGYQGELAENSRHVEAIQEGARVLVFAPEFLAGGRPPISYTPGLAVVRRDAFSNMQWERSGGHPLRLAYLDELPAFQPRNGPIFETARPGEADPLGRAISAAPVERFDFVWIVNSDKSPPLNDPRLEAVSRANRSTLYRVIAPLPDPGPRVKQP